jgi:hypothetical protein
MVLREAAIALAQLQPRRELRVPVCAILDRFNPDLVSDTRLFETNDLWITAFQIRSPSVVKSCTA